MFDALKNQTARVWSHCSNRSAFICCQFVSSIGVLFIWILSFSWPFGGWSIPTRPMPCIPALSRPGICARNWVNNSRLIYNLMKAFIFIHWIPCLIRNWIATRLKIWWTNLNLRDRAPLKSASSVTIWPRFVWMGIIQYLFDLLFKRNYHKIMISIAKKNWKCI